MRYMDEGNVSPRDILCLYTILHKPGITRHDLAKAVGVNAGVNVLRNVHKLTAWGYIEDRRQEVKRLAPSLLHITPAGIAFWESIKP